jgi:hypothetical protein
VLQRRPRVAKEPKDVFEEPLRIIKSGALKSTPSSTLTSVEKALIDQATVAWEFELMNDPWLPEELSNDLWIPAPELVKIESTVQPNLESEEMQILTGNRADL